jgi:arylsulfatase A-like enzyme
MAKSEGVRTKRWKYIRYFEQNPVCEELYDLESDSHESQNLAGGPSAAAQLTDMRLRCTELSQMAAAN